MSEVWQNQSALPGASATGFARVDEIGLRGAIVLRGDLSSSAVKNVATGIGGVDMPGTLGINLVEERAVAWMSPDELLLMMPYAEVDVALGQIHKTLEGQHYLAQNVSDTRAGFLVSGARAREVLAKLTPADVSPDAFSKGVVRRSKLGQVPAAFWLNDEGDIEVICFRSVAQYVFDLLANAAKAGSEVGYFSIPD